MRRFLHDLVREKGDGDLADATAVRAGSQACSYRRLAGDIDAVAGALAAAGVGRGDRVAVYLDKRVETVAAIFGASAAGAVFVPCNPVLKALQVHHILVDSGARLLISTNARLESLWDRLSESAVEAIVTLDDRPPKRPDSARVLSWQEFVRAGEGARAAPPATDGDMAAIFYTSGSTGKPKGVVLSHRNLVVGGESVAEYLRIDPDDRLLALLPLSFDAGFSQLTTGFSAGATVVLHNYLLPRDVLRVCARERITGLTCVPPLWMQLLDAEWPDEARRTMRYFANTGGRMPRETLARLRALFPDAAPYLMYGLTEAFRSTYLDPAEADRRPDSIGKAIPNAEILVVKKDGSLAGPGEDGELVHRGPLVSLGYWNDPERTARRFRPAPGRPDGLPLPEIAVYSGDIVRTDEDGFLYFVGRDDDMIKTSGYRVSPTEVEEALFDSGEIKEAAAFGVPHPTLGQAIVAAVVPADGAGFDEGRLLARCLELLPRYMVPSRIVVHGALPRSPNGKIDRRALAHAAASGEAPMEARS